MVAKPGIEPQPLLISSDSHAVEPPDLWATRLPVGLRDRAPVRGTHSAAHPGGDDPHRRIHEMAQDGVSAEVLFPNAGLELFGLADAALQQACFRVYNDWLAEYCAVNPERLIGVAAISMYDVDEAVKELERCAAAGLRGSMLWEVPHPDLPFASEHYARFWQASQALEMPVNLHILTGFVQTGRSTTGVERYRANTNRKLGGVMDTLFDFVFYGILDQHPGLKLSLVETEVGWLPFLLQQWDYYYKRFAHERPVPLTCLPSEVFQRQVYATFFDDPAGTRMVDWWGEDNLMWSSDFPHANSKWPNSISLVERDLARYPADVQAKLLNGNVSRLFNLQVSNLALAPA